MYKRVLFHGLLGVGLLAGASAYADQAPGFYAGAGIGQATLEADEFEGSTFDDSDTAFKVFGGYSFNEYFAAELTYFDGGAPSERFDFEGFTGNVEADISGFNASAVGRLPLGEVFTLFGKLGYSRYTVDVTARIEDISVSDDTSDNDLSYGVGAAFSLGRSFELRAEYEAIDVSDGGFNALTVSGLFRF